MWVGVAFFRPRALVFIVILAVGFMYTKITQNNKANVEEVDEVDEVEEEIIFKNN